MEFTVNVVTKKKSDFSIFHYHLGPTELIDTWRGGGEVGGQAGLHQILSGMKQDRSLPERGEAFLLKVSKFQQQIFLFSFVPIN